LRRRWRRIENALAFSTADDPAWATVLGITWQSCGGNMMQIIQEPDDGGAISCTGADLQGADRMTEPKPPKTPKVLDAIADTVLAYKPKPKTATAKKRNRRAAKIAKGQT
jgi:hypothetical protein